jgi:pyrroline-5-carboxylate reductase
VKPTVFLGGGRITGAFIAGLGLSGSKMPVIVHDHHPQKLRALERLYRVGIETDLHRAVEKASLLIVAVRPASVPNLLNQIGSIDRRLLAVSLAAGIPLSHLRRALRRPVRWARAMPSPACRTGHGLTALAFERGLPEADRKKVWALFGRVGDVTEIPERQFDAFTVTYSCSHGYHALQVLATAAQKIGLKRQSALVAATHALSCGNLSLRAGDLSLDELLREASTPGGIAATVISEMERQGYANAVERSLRAGLARAKANAKF